MSTIWKYELHVREHFILEMPKGAKVLAVQMQYGVPTLWARVNPTAEKEPRHFSIYGTGHCMPDESENVQLQYVGTFQPEGGALVFHLFENTHSNVPFSRGLGNE
jgi:hypothetical protein